MREGILRDPLETDDGDVPAAPEERRLLCRSIEIGERKTAKTGLGCLLDPRRNDRKGRVSASGGGDQPSGKPSGRSPRGRRFQEDRAPVTAGGPPGGLRAA